MTTQRETAEIVDIGSKVLNQNGVNSEPVAPRLHDFTLDFFTFFGAVVKQESRRVNGPVTVSLSDGLAEHFGIPKLRLCFEHGDLQPDYELMARGSRLYDLMLAYLKGRSAATFLELPKQFPASEELMQGVRPLNASITDLRMRETHRRYVVFNWHLTFRSDEKYEELYSVLLDDEGIRLPMAGTPGASEDAYALERMFADGTPVAQPGGEGEEGAGAEADATADSSSDGAKLPPMTHLVRLANEARKHAVYYADTQSAAHEAQILPRLYRTLNRITTYYHQQIEEVYDSHDRDGEKRQALQQDMERKIAEEVESHRLRVGIRLVSYAVFQAPVAVAAMTLSDGVREAPVHLTYNRYSGELRRPRCNACGQETTEIALDRNSHIACDNCIEQCATCQEIVCAACGVEACPVCDKLNCDACGEACWACGGRACPEHVDHCPVCGDLVCHACMEVCSECGTRQCRSHLLADAVVGADGQHAMICDTCAVRCSGCRQYSAKVGVCEASGQQFCHNCLVTCASCNRTVGPGYFERSSIDSRAVCKACLRECPSCGRTTPDIERCARCGTEYCSTCGLHCDVCGGHCCDGRYERFDRCGHVVCAEHETQCAVGGEAICVVCSETCGVCEKPFCATHSLRCLHCGQRYCGNCIELSGMCATCEGLGADDVDGIDMAGEPCAADLEVAAMAPHYEWRRARNARYLIYEGSHRFFGGVVVVVDAKRAATDVVDVRRFSPLEMMRKRLFGSHAND